MTRRTIVVHARELREPPVRRLVPPDAPSGRGLRMVARLANWGWRQDTGGKVVWADLSKAASFAMA